MPVLRVFGKKKVQRAQAQEWKWRQEQEGQETRGQGREGEPLNWWEGHGSLQVGNKWEELRATPAGAASSATRTAPAPPTTPTTRYTRPLTVQSEWIGTRRYLSNVPYTLPKDAPEADRLNFQHYYLRRLFKGLYLAPLERSRVSSVLDAGCGTGRWACDMAQDFSHAQVVGLDLELPQPGASMKPPNLTFASGNVLERLPFADHSFDYVHQRFLVSAIPTGCWPGVVAELARVTRPGGWIELTESADCYLNVGPALAQALHWNRTMNSIRGIDAGCMAYLDDLLLGAGLVGVEKRILRVPIGSWGGHMGSTLAQNMLAAFEGLRDIYCQHMQLPPAQFDAILSMLTDEWNAFHTEFVLFVAYGHVRLKY